MKLLKNHTCIAISSGVRDVMVRGLFKYECKYLHNFLHIYATTRCHTFLERTICCLENGTKHKDTLIIFFELQTLI